MCLWFDPGSRGMRFAIDLQKRGQEHYFTTHPRGGNLECAQNGRSILSHHSLSLHHCISLVLLALTVRRSDQSGSLKDLWMMDFIYLCDQEVLRKLVFLSDYREISHPSRSFNSNLAVWKNGKYDFSPTQYLNHY